MFDKHLPRPPRTPARNILTPLVRWTLTLLVAILVLTAIPLPAPSGSDSGVTYTHSVEAKKKKKKKKAKKKKKHKGGKTTPTPTPKPIVTPTPTPIPTDDCEFTKTETTWTLLDDCSTTETITVPSGVTLEGENRTITAKGPMSGFNRAVLRVNDPAAATHVHNVKLEGSGVMGSCEDGDFSGIRYLNASGSITGVDVANFRRTEDCGDGMVITATEANHTVDIAESRVADSAVGIEVVAVDTSIKDTAIKGDDFGISVAEAQAELSGNTITGSEDAAIGLLVEEGSDVDITGNTFASWTFGIGVVTGSTAQILDTSITGAKGIRVEGDSSSASIAGSDFNVIAEGVVVADGADATISGNNIQTYFSGVLVWGGASAEVTSNTMTGGDRPVGTSAYGVSFTDDSTGAINDNTISDFECGLGFNSHAGLTVGSNTFASNTYNECPPRWHHGARNGPA